MRLMMLKLLAALIVVGLLGPRRAPAQPPRAADAEEAAIRAVVAEFTRAFNAGDARGVAALFTDDARIATERGDRIEGRGAVEKLFAESLSASPGQSIVVTADSLRMLGSEAALEEGTAAITIPSSDGGAPRVESSRYTAAYVKKDGKWLQHDVHDYPLFEPTAAPSAHDRLKDLEWLVGDWIDENDEAEVRTACDWSEDGAFLLRAFEMKAAGRIAMSGVQRIGWDPRLKQFRSWVFDSDGGFSDGLWSRDDQGRWIVKTTGVLKDGRTVSATRILTRIGADSMRSEAVDRTLDDDALPGLEAVLLVRTPPPPHVHDHASTTRQPRKPE